MDKIDISNLALTKTGGMPIQDINDPYDENARLCKLIFDPVLEEALREYPWNFSLDMTTLSQIAEEPEFDWQYKYQLPNDYIRIIRTENEDPYKIMGGELYTDITPCKVLYQKTISDLNMVDSSFAIALSTELAVRLSYTLTQSRAQTDALIQEAKYAWTKARNIDSAESPLDRVQQSKWLEGRLTGTTAYVGNETGYRDISNVDPNNLVGGQ